MAESVTGAETNELTAAESNFQKNQLEEAEVICRKILQESERNIRAMILMGKIMLRRYRVDEGIRYLEKAVETDPKYILAYKLLGEVYYNKGELDKAISQFKKILEIDPLDIDAHKKVQDLSPRVPTVASAATAPSPPEVQPLPVEEKKMPAALPVNERPPAVAPSVLPAPPVAPVPPPSPPAPVAESKPLVEVKETPAPVPPAPLVTAAPAPAPAPQAPVAAAAPIMQQVNPPAGAETKAPAAPPAKPVSQQEAMELIKGRVVPLPPKAKTIIDKNLSEIKEIPGVIGSILINKDGLTIGSSLSQNTEMDKELVGALSLSIYKATKNAINTLNQGSLNQVTLQTKDRIITIFNSDDFILTTVMQRTANLGLVRLENGRSIKRISEHFQTEKE